MARRGDEFPDEGKKSSRSRKGRGYGGGSRRRGERRPDDEARPARRQPHRARELDDDGLEDFDGEGENGFESDIDDDFDDDFASNDLDRDEIEDGLDDTEDDDDLDWRRQGRR